MIKPEDIDILISRFLSGEASPEEAMLLEDWKQESEGNLLYYTECERSFILAGGDEPVPGPDIQAAWENTRRRLQQAQLKPVRRKPFYLVAASVLLLAGIGTVLFYTLRNTGSGQTDLATHTQSEQMTLADGSDVKVMPNSHLTAYEGFGTRHRRLRLEGSAYFSVTHQDKLPLVVDAGKVFIQDIGTRFLIRCPEGSDTVYVQVDEGTVLLFDSLGASLEMHAPAKAYYIRSAQKIWSGSTEPASGLNFSGTRLDDIVKQLNALYHTHITLENRRLGDCTITTRFNGEDLETILQVITETLGVRYEKTAGGYTILGESCGY